MLTETELWCIRLISTCNTKLHGDSFGCCLFTVRGPGVSGERRDIVAATVATGEVGDGADSIAVLSSGHLL